MKPNSAYSRIWDVLAHTLFWGSRRWNPLEGDTRNGCSFFFRRTKGKLYPADPKCQTHSLNVVLSQTRPHDCVYSLRLLDVTVCLVSAPTTHASSFLFALFVGSGNTFSQQPGPAILFTSAGKMIVRNNIIEDSNLAHLANPLR